MRKREYEIRASTQSQLLAQGLVPFVRAYIVEHNNGIRPETRPKVIECLHTQGRVGVQQQNVNRPIHLPMKRRLQPSIDAL